DVPLTARQLGIPENTLRQWHDGTRHPEASGLAEQAKVPLAERFEALVFRLLDIVEAKLDQLPADKAMLAAAIATDKMLLLRGQPPPDRPNGTVRVTVVAPRIDQLQAAFLAAAQREVAAETGAPPPAPEHGAAGAPGDDGFLPGRHRAGSYPPP